MNAAKLAAFFAAGAGIGFGLCSFSAIALQGRHGRGPNIFALVCGAVCLLCLLGLLITGIIALFQAIFGRDKP